MESTFLNNLPNNGTMFDLNTLLQNDNLTEQESRILYFKNKKHTFKAKITKQIFGETVKIGGDQYNDCINISISLSDNIVTRAKISHIESEPECVVGSILEDGDTAEFVKSSLLFCKSQDPTVKTL